MTKKKKLPSLPRPKYFSLKTKGQEEINPINDIWIIDRALTCLQTSSFGAFLSASIIEYGFFLHSSATFGQYFAVDMPHKYKLVI